MSYKSVVSRAATPLRTQGSDARAQKAAPPAAPQRHGRPSAVRLAVGDAGAACARLPSARASELGDRSDKTKIEGDLPCPPRETETVRKPTCCAFTFFLWRLYGA